MSSERLRIREILERTIPIVQSKHRLAREEEIEKALELALPNENWRNAVWITPFNRVERQVCAFRGDKSVVVRMVRIKKTWVPALPIKSGAGGPLAHLISRHR